MTDPHTHVSAGSAEALALADQYEAGMNRALASGYEEFGPLWESQHRLVIKALRSFAAAQAVWMPIETAPRDGTDIIVYRPKFDGDYIPRVGTDYWMLKLLEPTWARSRKDCPPTHWMHFPEPPK